MTCARCGAPIIGGRWTIPTARGLLCFCTGCMEAPKVMRLFEKPPAPFCALDFRKTDTDKGSRLN